MEKKSFRFLAPALLIISYLNLILNSPAWIILFLLISLGAVLFTKEKRSFLAALLLGLLYLLAVNDIRNNDSFREKRLFGIRDTVEKEYMGLKADFYEKRREIVKKEYAQESDIGYTVRDLEYTLTQWSGRKPFDDLRKRVFYPRLDIAGNDASLVFQFYDENRIYALRHFITALYGTEKTKSHWLRHIQGRFDTRINLYFTPGQFYIYDEPILYNDIRKGESVYLSSAHALYSKMEDNIILKIQSHPLSWYMTETKKRFFLLNALLFLLFAFLTSEKGRRLDLGAVALLLVSLAFFPKVSLILFLSYLAWKCRGVIPRFRERGLRQQEILDLALGYQVFLLAWHYFFSHTTAYVKMAFWMGVLMKDKGLTIASFVLLFFITVYAARLIKVTHKWALAGALFLLLLSLDPTLLLLAVGGLLPLALFAVKKRTALWAFYFYLLFIPFIPIPAQLIKGVDRKMVRSQMEMIEAEPARVMFETVEKLCKDQAFLWSLKENVHYDDDNFAFFKWLRSPLSEKPYMNFIYFENKNGDIYSRYGSGCSVQPFRASPGSISFTEGFHLFKAPLTFEGEFVGNVVIGVKDDFFMHVPDIPELFFSHVKKGRVVFSTLVYDAEVTRDMPVKRMGGTGDYYRFYIKAPWKIAVKYIFFILISEIIVLLVCGLFSQKWRSMANDFVKRNMLIILLLLMIPTSANILLLFSGIVMDIRQSLRERIISHKEEMISRLEREDPLDLFDPVRSREIASSLDKDMGNWTLYKGPERLLSYDEDSYRVNMKNTYLSRHDLIDIYVHREQWKLDYSVPSLRHRFLWDRYPGIVFELSAVLPRPTLWRITESFAFSLMVQFFVVALTVLLLYKNAGHLLKPLSKIIVATKEVSLGNFNHRVETKTPISEMKVLFTNFNSMVKRLAILKNSFIENQNFLKTIIDSLPVGAVTYDERGHVAICNEALRRFFPGLAYKDSVPERLPFPLDYFREGQGELREKGTVFRYSIKKFKYGYIFLLSDITGLILSEKFDLWFQLTQELAHELKNPLMPIRFSLNRLEKMTEEAVNEEQVKESMKDLYGIIHEELESIQRLIDRFREQTLEGEREIRHIDVGESLKRIIASFTSCNIDLHVSKSLPPVPFSQEKFDLIIKNILENSLEATGEGALIRVAAYYDLYKGRFDAGSCQSNQKYVIIHVRDYSGGIEKDVLDRIFEPYFTNKKGGSGLGLYLVRKYMEEFQGVVGINVRDREGTDIYLLFQTEKETDGGS